MTLQLINPDGMPAPVGYTHVVVATGGALVFIAGQEPEDARGALVGPGDLAAQARQVFANLGRALAADARLGQVAKITIDVVHHRPEYLPVIESKPRLTCSAGTSQPTRSWAWRHWPDPAT
jgi:enamine deaminase RidA (YjgF/YER057c/UK114 family)